MALSTDALDFLLDPLTGDLDLSGGRLNFARGLPGVAQLARIRVSTIRGELFWDTTFGLPLVQNKFVSAADALLGQKFNQTKAVNAYRDVLATTPNVTEVLLLEVTFDDRTRKMKIRWQLRTTFGDTPVEELTK